KLCCLYDDNEVTLAAGADICFSEDRAARFAAYGWHTQVVEDGNDLHALDAALHAAHAQDTRPSLILVRSHIGFGSPLQDSYQAHGSPLGADNVRQTKQRLGWPLDPEFLIPPEVQAQFHLARLRGADDEAAWNQRLVNYRQAFPALAEELEQRLDGELRSGWDAGIPVFPTDAKGLASREASGQVMNAIAPRLPALFGGSADLNPSPKTVLKGQGDFNSALIQG